MVNEETNSLDTQYNLQKEQNNKSNQSNPQQNTNMPRKRLKKLLLLFSIIIFIVLLSLVGTKVIKKAIRGINLNQGGTNTTEIPTDDYEPSQPGQIGNVCKANEEISCSELGVSWKSGTATCKENQAGYDVSQCVSASQVGRAEVVKPADRNELWQTAQCNDGTPFTYEIQLSPTNSKNWVVYLEGGGFCDDNANSCSTRPPSHHSTLRNPNTAAVVPDKEVIPFEKAGVFGANKSKNPTFYDANKVFAEYCSSDAWSGATAQRRPTTGDPKSGWFFSGRLNVEALFESLIAYYGLDDANSQTEVLFSGGSAGGGGVNVNSDTVARLLPQTAKDKRLRLLNDAGATTEYFDNPSYLPGTADGTVRQVFLQAYDFFGSKANSVCEQALKEKADDPRRCLFTSVNYEYVVNEPPQGLGLPYLVAHSATDEFALGLFQIDPQRNAAVLEEYRQASLESFENIDWLFSGWVKPYHTILTKDGQDGFHMPSPRGTFQEVVTRFWEGGRPERITFGD